jgi:hypothetical protein
VEININLINMKKKLALFTFLVTLSLQFLVGNMFAQSFSANQRLILQGGERWIPENFENFLISDDVQLDEIFEGEYHRILQFFQVPTNREKAELENLGIKFLDYFPHKAFIVSIPLTLNKAHLKK